MRPVESRRPSALSCDPLTHSVRRFSGPARLEDLRGFTTIAAGARMRETHRRSTASLTRDSREDFDIAHAPGAFERKDLDQPIVPGTEACLS
jgi:hypothetical protein